MDPSNAITGEQPHLKMFLLFEWAYAIFAFIHMKLQTTYLLLYSKKAQIVSGKVYTVFHVTGDNKKY